MKMIYGVISDPHYHSWSAFSTIHVSGLNSRLKIQLDATIEAAKAIKASGAKYMFVAGDTFHTRGSITPSVLHFVTETYKQIINEIGLSVIMLAGNHDLETNDSVFSANAAASLQSIGVTIVCGPAHSVKIEDITVHFISWRNSHAELLADMKSLREKAGDGIHDIVIHTGINKAIPTMPDVGIEAQNLQDLGFRLVLSGHYHNHKEIIPGVVSVGALTHQNWGDVGTLAGFMIVSADGSFTQHETTAPKFVSLEGDVTEDEIRGNYVRYRAVIEDEHEGIHLKEQLATLGAAGVVTNLIKKSSMMAGTASTEPTSKIDSLSESISAYCKVVHDTDGGFDLAKLDSLCNEILLEAESAGASE